MSETPSLQPVNIHTTDTIEQIGIEALLKSFRRHETLGARGIEMAKKNQFGDMTMRGDIEAENAVIQYLMEQNFPITI